MTIDIGALLQRNEHAGEDGQCSECGEFSGHSERGCDYADAMVEYGLEPHQKQPRTTFGKAADAMFERNALILITEGNTWKQNRIESLS